MFLCLTALPFKTQGGMGILGIMNISSRVNASMCRSNIDLRWGKEFQENSPPTTQKVVFASTGSNTGIILLWRRSRICGEEDNYMNDGNHHGKSTITDAIFLMNFEQKKAPGNVNVRRSSTMERTF